MSISFHRIKPFEDICPANTNPNVNFFSTELNHLKIFVLLIQIQMPISFHRIKPFEVSDKHNSAVILFVDILVQQFDMRHARVDFIYSLDAVSVEGRV
jgi:hypothetical protein